MAQRYTVGLLRRHHSYLALAAAVALAAGQTQAQFTNWMPGPGQPAYATNPAVASLGAPSQPVYTAFSQAPQVAPTPAMSTMPNGMPNGMVETNGNAYSQPMPQAGNYESTPCYGAGAGAAAGQGAYGAGAGGAACSGAGMGSGMGGGYYGGGNCAYVPQARWSGYAGALMLTRESENHRNFSYDGNNEADQLLDSQESNFDWGAGFEVHLLRMDACSSWGCEAVYWGLFPGETTAFAYPSMVTGPLNGIFNFDQLDYNGVTADNSVNGAEVHRLRRNTELHNVELNHIWDLTGSFGALGLSGCAGYGAGGMGGSCCNPCCNPCGSGAAALWSVRGLVGFRYLHYSDELEFASDPTNTVFTGAAEELYYLMDTSNNLYGVQMGTMAIRALGTSRWGLTFGAKAGIYANDADAHSWIGGSAGTATINNGPNDGMAWDIYSSKTDVATIAELSAGALYQITPNWRLRGEYRVIGISGVALPTNQIYQDLRGIQDVQLLSTNGDLILHGVFVGAELNY